MLNLKSPLKTKILIIGAGPAGLSFASRFSTYSKDFLIVDMGSEIDLRLRDDSFDCIAGVGGAGLFSDGKFSFFPSGTAVWTLPEEEILKESYEYLEGLFRKAIDVEIPEFPDQGEIAKLTANTSYELKKYPCFYIPLEKRKELIRYMIEKIPKLLCNHKVLTWEKVHGQYLVHLENTKTQEKIDVLCDKIVLAGGRFHPLFHDNIPKIFKRYEYGLRLVGPNEEFSKVTTQEEILDPKWMYRPSSGLEFRTFCMCKDGEYVCSDFMGIRSYSGRADIPATGSTNFGLTSRIKVENDEDFEKVLKCGPFEIGLESVVGDPRILKKIFGEKLGEIYMEGLLKFIENFKLEVGNLKVIGPSIEGIGRYPKINENLQVEGENIFVIGDSSGIFRGIIPGMISGIYIANYCSMNMKT